VCEYSIRASSLIASSAPEAAQVTIEAAVSRNPESYPQIVLKDLLITPGDPD
jgi:hypothetical protein